MEFSAQTIHFPAGLRERFKPVTLVNGKKIYDLDVSNWIFALNNNARVVVQKVWAE